MTNDPRNIFVDNRHSFSKNQTTNNGKQKEQNAQNNASQRAQTGDDFVRQSSGASNGYAEKVEQMKRLAQKYQREGEGQLVKDIVSNVIEQKARGNLTNDQLVQFAKRISPLLNAEQQTRLDNLVAELLKL